MIFVLFPIPFSYNRFAFFFAFFFFHSWITLEQGKTTADAMGDVWRGLEVVEAATRVGSDMLVRIKIEYYLFICVHMMCAFAFVLVSSHNTYVTVLVSRGIHCKIYRVAWILFRIVFRWECVLVLVS